MNDSSKTTRVGLFVMVGLVVMAGLIIKFSKSGAWFTPTYQIKLVVGNVAGIKDGASVLMAGVPVGNVEKAELAPDGLTVLLQLKVLQKYRDRIHRDARFLVEQAGFLGDQYVSIVPGKNKDPVIEDGETVRGEDAFNFQEIARSASGLMQRVDQTVAKLNQSITRVDEVLLSTETLTNITYAVSNFRAMSDRALVAIDSVDRMLKTNAPVVGTSVSNLAMFSHELRGVSGELRLVIETNRAQVFNAISNVETATRQVNRLLDGVEQGHGLAGSIFKNPQLEQNISMLTSNLNVASSNLNKHGLWRFLWKPKSP